MSRQLAAILLNFKECRLKVKDQIYQIWWHCHSPHLLRRQRWPQWRRPRQRRPQLKTTMTKTTITNTTMTRSLFIMFYDTSDASEVCSKNFRIFVILFIGTYNKNEIFVLYTIHRVPNRHFYISLLLTSAWNLGIGWILNSFLVLPK